MLDINQVYLGDCLEVMKEVDDNSIDSIATDPPYGLKFMGKKWDYDIPSIEIWQECLRILKPGGHMLCFAGTRTQHRMVVNIEDAGFEIRDCIMWIYGSGFPKSLDIGKAIDKMAGAEREVVGSADRKNGNSGFVGGDKIPQVTTPVTPEAKQWDGWGTNLKPAYEPIYLCRKPISEKTIAANVLRWGVGGLNIDGCRIEVDNNDKNFRYNPSSGGKSYLNPKGYRPENNINYKGRWPANITHDGSEQVMARFPYQKSGARNGTSKPKYGGNSFNRSITLDTTNCNASEGSAARFFYCAKASKKERGDSNHPTVKPLKLIEYLIKLITPGNYIVLDCFAGSGTTGIAAKNTNRNFILIEKEKEYVDIIQKRLKGWTPKQIKTKQKTVVKSLSLL